MVTSGYSIARNQEAAMPDGDVAVDGQAADLAAEDLRAAQLLWATVDSPWVHAVDTDKYLATVQPLRDMDAETVLCTHLPPAVGLAPQMLDTLAEAPAAAPFVGPDQAALEQMLAGFEPGPGGAVPPQAM